MHLAKTLGVGAVLLALPVAAQQVDPRIATPMVQALQAQLALSQAIAKARQEDAEEAWAAERAAMAPALNAHRWATNPLAGLK